MDRAGVLVAVRPAVEEAAREALGRTGLPMVFTYTLEDAQRKIEERAFRLIVGTLQFDDSRLFDLLPIARSTGTPLVAIKLTESQLPDYVIEAFFRAADLLGFNGWMDVHRLGQQYGRDEALDRLTALLTRTALR